MGELRPEDRPAPPRADRPPARGGWARAMALSLLAAALLASATVTVFWFAGQDAREAVQFGVSTLLGGTALALNTVQFVTNRRAHRPR